MDPTVRSMIQPDPIRLWRVETTEEGQLLHVAVHWDIVPVTIADEMTGEQRTEYEYKETRLALPYRGSPDFILDWLNKNQGQLLLQAKVKWGREYETAALSSEEQAQLIDHETGSAINERLHPVASIEEQIGILRDQLVNLLNALGIAPTPEFDAMNTIALEEIAAGQVKKGAL